MYGSLEGTANDWSQAFKANVSISPCLFIAGHFVELVSLPALKSLTI